MLHDYYTGDYLPGVKKSVKDFESEIGENLYKVPSEVSTSLIIIKA